jgi:hypothetical protein
VKLAVDVLGDEDGELVDVDTIRPEPPREPWLLGKQVVVHQSPLLARQRGEKALPVTKVEGHPWPGSGTNA